MISLNLKNAFNNLDIEDKKNKISDELLFIGELIKKLQTYYGIEPNFKIKNYNINEKSSEEEYLTFIYEDIFEIQKQLLTIITNIQNNQ